jgi:AcrR family transcriptional regulator
MAEAAATTAVPNRRERRKLEVRGRILEAAHELFEQKGLAATRVADICERADVAEKTFFNHFATRQVLLGAMAEAAIGDLLADVEEARASKETAADRLAHLFDIFGRSAEAAGPMHRELLTEITHTAHAEAGPEKSKLLHDAFGSIVRDGVERGDVTTQHDPETLTEAVLGTFYSLMFSWANIPGFPLAERARAAARFLGEALAPPATTPDSRNTR